MRFFLRIAAFILLPMFLVGTAAAMDHTHHRAGHGDEHRMHAEDGHSGTPVSVADRSLPMTHGDICVSDPLGGGHHSDHDDCLGCCPDSAGSSEGITVVRTVDDQVQASSVRTTWTHKAVVLASGSTEPSRPIPLSSKSVLRL